ncbi:MAG TPA: cyclic nucleotide-binding domain-containing protein [Kofleriaceae bacterium]|nr:cyclic nucleotide-binding domain-containing protein [Kofleriaceae bacterium]
MKNARKLREQANADLDKGRYARALDSYLALEQLEPDNGDWARRSADMYRRLDRDQEAIVALERAADRYAKAGFLVKAVAVCKMILQNAPEHPGAFERLAALQNERGMPAARARMSARTPAADEGAPAAASPPPPAPPSVPVLELDVAEELELLPQNAPLDAMHLADVMPDAERQKREDGTESGITFIPLDDEDLDIIDDLELEVDDGDEEARRVAAARLEGTPLFAALGRVALETMVDRMDLIELDAGAVLFHQGDRGNTLYVIVEGEVGVVSEGPPRAQISRLGDGQFFGEIALVTEQPRNATIEALADTQLLAIDRDVIHEVVKREPAVLKVLLRFLRDRLLANLVNSSPLFQPFQGTERKTLASKFHFLEVDQGGVLIAQGGRASGLFVLLSGQAEVVLARDGAEQRLATLRPGDIFGEMSLLGGTDAIATVRTTSKCFALEMPAADFRTTIMTHPQVLMVVGDLADERKRKFDAIASGEADYDEGHLELV